MIIINLIRKDFLSKYFLPVIYLGLLVWFVIKAFDTTTYIFVYPNLFNFQKHISNFLFYLFVVFYLYQWIKCSKRKIELVLFFVFIVFSTISKKFSSNPLVFDLFFVPLFLAKYLDREKFLNIALLGLLLFFILDVSLYFTGFLPNLEKFYRSSLNIERMSLGLIHPNNVGFYSMLFCFLYVLKRKHFYVIDYLILIGFSIFCYKIPNSITTTCIILLLAIACLVDNYLLKNTLTKKYNNVLLWSILFVVGFVLFLTYFITFTGMFKQYLVNMPGEIWARFVLSKMWFDNLGISLFGDFASIKDLALRKVIVCVDCVYFYLPIYYGYAVYIFYMLLLLYILVISVFRFEYLLAFIIVLTVIYGVSEKLACLASFMPIYAYLFCSRFEYIRLKKEI